MKNVSDRLRNIQMDKGDLDVVLLARVNASILVGANTSNNRITSLVQGSVYREFVWQYWNDNKHKGEIWI